MKRSGRGAAARSLVMALVVGVLLTVVAAPAAAYHVIGHRGTPGSYRLEDSASTPGGICHYGAPNAHGFAAIDFVRARVPIVHPQSNRQSQMVSWQILVERRPRAGDPWTEVAKSPIQKAAAKAGLNGTAPFKPMKVSYSAHYDLSLVRAISVLRWYGPAGGVVARIQAWLTDYHAVWTVGATDYVFDQGWCWSSAD